MKKKLFLRLFSFIFIVIMSILFLNEIKIYNVIQTQRKVEARIIEMPDCCNCNQMYAKYKVNSYIFSSRVAFNFCEVYKVGDTQKFYHSQKYSDIFVSELYEQNSSTTQLISSTLLLLFFASVFIYSFNNDRNKKGRIS